MRCASNKNFKVYLKIAQAWTILHVQQSNMHHFLFACLFRQMNSVTCTQRTRKWNINRKRMESMMREREWKRWKNTMSIQIWLNELLWLHLTFSKWMDSVFEIKNHLDFKQIVVFFFHFEKIYFIYGTDFTFVFKWNTKCDMVDWLSKCHFQWWYHIILILLNPLTFT